jgi:predicted permease
VLILNTLAPVFLMIALGAVMQRTGFVTAGFLKEANRVTYWLGLPALLFSQLAGSAHEVGSAKLTLGVMLGAMALVVGTGYLVAWILRVPGSVMGTFVQAVSRGNVAFVGLPIIYSLPDATLASGLSVRAEAIIVVAPMMVVFNFVSVVVLVLSQHPISFRMAIPLFKQLATTPPLLATLAGLLFVVMGWTLPSAVDKTFAALGEMALPLGLLGVGGAMITVRLGSNWRTPLVAALVKTLLSPLFGWAIARLLGLGVTETKMVMILMATPTAVVSYTVALELKGDEGLAAGAIVLSVVTSLVTLALIVGLF